MAAAASSTGARTCIKTEASYPERGKGFQNDVCKKELDVEMCICSDKCSHRFILAVLQARKLCMCFGLAAREANQQSVNILCFSAFCSRYSSDQADSYLGNSERKMGEQKEYLVQLTRSYNRRHQEISSRIFKKPLIWLEIYGKSHCNALIHKQQHINIHRQYHVNIHKQHQVNLK